MICKKCGKEFTTQGALNAHIGWHNKPNRVSNFEEYNRKISSGEIKKEYTNQYTKAKSLGKTIEMKRETKDKLSKIRKKFNKEYWSEENRKKHSIIMRNAVKKNPDSYSISNISGRVKSYDYTDSYGNKIKLKGKWELKVAMFLDNKNIEWTNIVIPQEYFWNYDNNTHLYFPDFYLPDYDTFLEIKGFERDRDRSKWDNFIGRLLIIRKKDINDLDEWYEKYF